MNSAHEVGHIPQLLEKGGLSQFVIEITDQYIKSGHDEPQLVWVCNPHVQTQETCNLSQNPATHTLPSPSHP